MPKKIIAVLVVMVLLCLTGCSLLESDSGNSAANAYIAAAQQAMDKQDYDAAAQILEEGLSKANDPALEEMLAEVLTKQAATKTENDAESELPAGEIEGVYESADGEGPAIKIENDTFYIDITADSEVLIAFNTG